VEAVLTTLVGGVLAIAGGLVGVALSDRRERSRWLRDSQWQASVNLLSALQLVVRRMTNVAYQDSNDTTSPTSVAFIEAMLEWNSAIYGALLAVPPRVAAEIPNLDREVDRLLDVAVTKAWTRTDFRQERVKLGRMAADYLKLSRKLAGLADIDLPSIWLWDDGSGKPLTRTMTPDETIFPRKMLRHRRFGFPSQRASRHV
jgi:hypothetical protein